MERAAAGGVDAGRDEWQPGEPWAGVLGLRLGAQGLGRDPGTLVPTDQTHTCCAQTSCAPGGGAQGGRALLCRCPEDPPSGEAEGRAAGWQDGCVCAWVCVCAHMCLGVCAEQDVCVYTCAYACGV